DAGGERCRADAGCGRGRTAAARVRGARGRVPERADEADARNRTRGRRGERRDGGGDLREPAGPARRGQRRRAHGARARRGALSQLPAAGVHAGAAAGRRGGCAMSAGTRRHGAPPRWHAATPAGLADALDTAARLLNSLVQVLHRQRDAIAAADVERIDECVHAAHRVLLTLSEAQRHRRTLLGTLAGTEDVPLRSLGHALGASATAEVVAARDRLLDAAAVAGREVAVNRQIVDAAVAAGDAQLRLLGGAGARRLAYDARAHEVDGKGSGTLINRHA